MARKFEGLLVLLLCVGTCSVISSESSCARESSAPFLYRLQFRCPDSISLNLPLQVDGHFLDRLLDSKSYNGYTSIFFYADWSPFSLTAHPLFETLSSIFPQIDNFAVEQSTVMPSIFSRYGIHSVPSILLVNQTSMVRYSGPKNIYSLVRFYERNTGIEPVQYFMSDELTSPSNHEDPIMPLDGSMKDMIKREPYLIFSIIFICLRVLLVIYPKVVRHLNTFWVSHAPHLNLGIFGETSQTLGRILHVVDVRRVWMKLRLCKTRNFHEGAKSARVWASLASVSLGESSSARSSFLGRN